MKLTVLLTVFAFTAARLGFAQEDTDRVVQSKIMALEKAWNQAYKLGDKQALSRILDDQIVLINDDGSMQTKQVSCDRKEVQLPRSASRTGIHERACIWKYCDLDWSISS